VQARAVCDLAPTGRNRGGGDQTFGAAELGSDRFGITGYVRHRLPHLAGGVFERSVEKGERVDAGVCRQPNQVGRQRVALRVALGQPLGRP
jgi:hypothetical protein